MSEREAALAVLGRPEATLAQVMHALTTLDRETFATQRSIGLSASVTMDLLGLQLRRQAYVAGLRLDVHAGNYDDPVGDVDRFLSAKVEEMVVWPFFDNLMPGFEAQLGGLDPALIDAKEDELRARYRLVFERARPMRAVYVGSLHRLSACAEPGGQDDVARVLARFDRALREEAASFPNVRWLDSADAIRAVGEAAAFDLRFYFHGKAPYTAAFLGELARRIARASRGFGTYFYKVLVLDCDGTLWGGVVGEDLVAGIQLDPHDAPGSIYWRMQHEFRALERAGVLLCLCSKNNAADVDEVFAQRPEMVLNNAQIVSKRVNWEDKPSNLRSLAAELNLGLDSFVFLDDSSFECEAVRQQLPMVKTFQVPATLSAYPRVVAEIKALFLAGGIAAASRGKTDQYRQRASAEQARAAFDSQDDYLASLGLKVAVTKNHRASLPRISELSLKSNQFNLTTARYSEAEIDHRMTAADHAVYSLVVSDKFGDAGLTGVVTMRYVGDAAVVENFWMSCRVIGRGVEMRIWAPIVADAARRGCTTLRAEFVPSAKNAQVADFFDRLGLPLLEVTAAGVRRYAVATATFTAADTPWIELTYAE